MSGNRDQEEIRCHGVPASPGIARGPIHVFSIESDDVVHYIVDPVHVPDEIARFESALIQTRAQILEMQQQIAEEETALAPVVSWVDDPDRGCSRVKICTWDRAGLFNKIATPTRLRRLQLLNQPKKSELY